MKRVRVPELMDDPAVDPVELCRALAGIRRINRLSQSDAILWSSLRELAQQLAPKPLRILDVATGSGDLPIQLAQRFQKAGIAVDISACDISPIAIAEASQRASSAMQKIEFFTADAVREPVPNQYDAVICSLFLHHLDPGEAVTLLRHLGKMASHRVLVNDLRRSRLAWIMAHTVTRLVTRSPMVHYDGPASVRGAYTPQEAIQLAAKAGLKGAQAPRRWPFRYLLRWDRLAK